MSRDEWVTIREAVEMFEVKPNPLYMACRDGRLQSKTKMTRDQSGRMMRLRVVRVADVRRHLEHVPGERVCQRCRTYYVVDAPEHTICVACRAYDAEAQEWEARA